MTRQSSTIVWLIWAFVFVGVNGYLLTTNTFMMLASYEVLAFLGLVMLTAILPIQYRNHTLTFFQWVTLAVFIKYGFHLEVMMTQLAVITALLASGLTKASLIRIPINSIIFILTSIISASVFYLVGGQTGQAFTFLDHGHAMFLYAVSILVVNHVLIFATRRYLFNQRSLNSVKGLVRELTSAGILLPLVVILLILHKQLGSLAILFIGIAFVGIAIVFKLYNQMEKVNHLLKEVTEFGYELNSSLTAQELMNKVRGHLEKFLDWDQLYLYNVKGEELTLTYMDQKNEEAIPLTFRSGDEFSKQVAQGGFIAMETERSQWSLRGKWFHPDLQTILSVPLKDQTSVKGVLTVVSKRPNAYRSHQVMIVEIMTNMLAIALTNVLYLEKTKRDSHHCSLTNLFNFRFFEQELKDTLEDRHTNYTSLILLDLDHFKRINDTYGHQSGNEVLIEVAKRLETVCTNAKVARYGGEEFVLLIRNQTEEETYQLGLELQEILKQSPIIIQNDLIDQKLTEIYVTASIGVASSEKTNEDGEASMDAVTLIRRADRAMYNGAKQRGRDRVAKFSDLKKEQLI
ncbi:sensor domain-containing diguanylate cyclase [Halalkalibacter alkalisediminis]|uniref:Sensor domain-containing diguanylate cyclase n=1 Tax=Halalkalibacter alkalisediminis TaxID=935616 RepID=A0ABV6NAL7_9BACI|nr:sensor domain-containing diguanylate cyclase [Halalkalibacter alkalisediminis]